MARMPIDTHDARSRRCPMLGHDVTFAYCRAPGSDTPCRKILDCWWETFDIVAWVRETFGEEMPARLQAPPPDKPLTLFELMEQAKRIRDS